MLRLRTLELHLWPLFLFIIACGKMPQGRQTTTGASTGSSTASGTATAGATTAGASTTTAGATTAGATTAGATTAGATTAGATTAGATTAGATTAGATTAGATTAGATTAGASTSGTSPSTPAITSVAGTHVSRQGGPVISFTVNGNDLIEPSSVYFIGPASFRIDALISDASATSFDAGLQVPHGAPTGAYTLYATQGSSELSLDNALTVTPIVVRPSDNPSGAGNDDAAGTYDAPLATIHKAMSYADDGDTIQVRAGTISASPSEPFPIDLKAGVTVQGDVTYLVLWGGSLMAFPAASIEGSGSAGGQTVFETLGERTALRWLNIGSATTGVLVQHDSTTLDNVFVHDNIVGVIDDGVANLDLTDCTLDSNSIGLRVDRWTALPLSTKSAYLTRTFVQNNVTGVQLMGQSQTVIADSDIRNNGASVAAYNDGVFLQDTAMLHIRDSRITDNATAGIAVTNAARLYFSSGNELRAKVWGIYLGDASFAMSEGVNDIYLSSATVYAINDAQTAVHSSGSWPHFEHTTFHTTSGTTIGESGDYAGPSANDLADSDRPKTWRVEHAGMHLRF